MRSAVPEGFENHCLRCLMRREVCLCESILVVETKVHFVIVQHTVERLRTSNTGRLAALALPNCELLEYGGPIPFDPSKLEGPDTWLLYPSPSGRAGAAPRRLVVLDGSWHQSRKMYARLKLLHTMPCLSLAPPDPTLVRLRRPPNPGAMSTLEAVAAAVAHLEGEAKARPLFALHDAHASRILALKGYPKQ